MTNKEIVKKYDAFITPTDSHQVELPWQVLYKIQDSTRVDALREIEQRLQSLIPLPNNEFGAKLGTIMLIVAKELNSLKENK